MKYHQRVVSLIKLADAVFSILPNIYCKNVFTRFYFTNKNEIKNIFFIIRRYLIIQYISYFVFYFPKQPIL